ncbi:MAG: TIGR00730 family Rossman fold protein, partial [Clostridia bacterium]|nr:TIGR00730 family Rossman fold protein [Clostridia bacterium]
MRICIFGSASDDIDRLYIEAGEKLGEMLGKKGHSLVFGAGNSGMMGAVARGFHRTGAEIVGVVPSFFPDGVLFPH